MIGNSFIIVLCINCTEEWILPQHFHICLFTSMIGSVLETLWWYLDWKDRNSGMLGNVYNSILKRNEFSWWEMKLHGHEVCHQVKASVLHDYGLLSCSCLCQGSSGNTKHSHLIKARVLTGCGQPCCCMALLSVHAAPQTRTPAVSRCGAHATVRKRFVIYVDFEKTSVGTFECDTSWYQIL